MCGVVGVGNWVRCGREKIEGCAAINYGSLPPTFPSLFNVGDELIVRRN